MAGAGIAANGIAMGRRYGSEVGLGSEAADSKLTSCLAMKWPQRTAQGF